MKLELSIPDALATAAHRAANALGMSRSELFARAVAAFLKSGHDAVHTEKSRHEGTRDPVWTEGWDPAH
jgi:metal-responsive CopG/Arc/MetJ family transcriptional regulator